MNEYNAWKTLKETADNVLETTLKDTISRKVEYFTTIIYTVGRETFGTEEVKVKQQVEPSTNRRKVQIRKTGSEVNKKTVEKG